MELYGDVTNDGVNQYLYDGEGRICAVSTTPCAGNPPLMSWAQYNGTVNGSGNNQMSATNQNANQASGYDAAGDLTNDGVNQYLYDGEGRICAVASTPVAGLTTLTGYIYDADGARVSKGTLAQFTCDMNPADSAFNGFQPTNDYVLGPTGEQVAEMGVGGSTDGSASSGLVWLHTNIWAGGLLLGTYDGGAGIISADSTYGLHFYFNDPLGTRRVQTDYAGVVEQTCQSLPYGDGETCAPTPTENLFTGKERDAETNNDYFGARYYRSSMGRWMSPDWASSSQAVPYASYADPQTLNLYGYMGNNPLAGVDKDGHNPVLIGAIIVIGVGVIIYEGYELYEKSQDAAKEKERMINEVSDPNATTHEFDNLNTVTTPKERKVVVDAGMTAIKAVSTASDTETAAGVVVNGPVETLTNPANAVEVVQHSVSDTLQTGNEVEQQQSQPNTATPQQQPQTPQQPLPTPQPSTSTPPPTPKPTCDSNNCQDNAQRDTHD